MPNFQRTADYGPASFVLLVAASAAWLWFAWGGA
jgi:hypothetical protein